MSQPDKKIVHIHLPADEKFTSTLNAGSHQMVADEPESAGGNNEGPDPYDYLLMSLGSCSLMTVKMYAQQKNWKLGDLYMELRHHKSHEEDCLHCEDPESKIDKIEKDLIVKGDLTDEQLDKLLEISEKCPVHRTLMSDINIESSIERR
ncbi:MAG TPA: OsmC family protein [Balneolaceae bacterium]